MKRKNENGNENENGIENNENENENNNNNNINDENETENENGKHSNKIQKKEEFTALNDLKTDLINLLNHMMNHKYAGLFNRPVDPVLDGVPDYLERIKSPMDFSTVKKKVENDEYKQFPEFITDVNLIFANCRTYNSTGSEIVRQANVLAKYFEKQVRPLRPNPKRKVDSASSEMSSMLEELKGEQLKLMQELNKLVQERSKPLKEEFTFKEKEELSKQIGNLSAKDLLGVPAILGEELKQEGEDVEIDIEKLSVPVLRKLKNYVDLKIEESKAE